MLRYQQEIKKRTFSSLKRFSSPKIKCICRFCGTLQLHSASGNSSPKAFLLMSNQANCCVIHRHCAVANFKFSKTATCEWESIYLLNQWPIKPRERISKNKAQVYDHFKFDTSGWRSSHKRNLHTDCRYWRMQTRKCFTTAGTFLAGENLRRQEICVNKAKEESERERHCFYRYIYFDLLFFSEFSVSDLLL